MTSLRVAVCQLQSIDDVETNLRSILVLLEQIREKGGADIICFPENCLYLRLSKQPIPGVSLQDAAFETLKAKADQFNAFIFFGSVPLKEDGKLSNATVLCAPGEKPKVVYRKIHLFDVDVVGAERVRESDIFNPGKEPSVLTVRDWKLGLSICYDLRFSELYASYAKSKVDGILVPSAFLVPTGSAHWHVLTRARAIECQAYLLAAAQGGEHKNAQGDRRETYGHSLIVDPWGRVLAEADLEPGVIWAELRKDEIARVRRQIPTFDHRRL